MTSRTLFAAAALGIAAIAATTTFSPASAYMAEEAKILPAPKVKASEPAKLQVAIFAGGCFWGVEGVFSHVKGVKSAVSGYHGGSAATATYKQVGDGTTGHAEAVRIVYDPKVVSYDQLLQVFFSVTTDPTQLNRQGPDVGSDYRNAIVPMNKDQLKVARAYIGQLKAAKIWSKPIVTKIEGYKKFYEAEDYHQDFMFENPRHGYIVRWDKPKVENLKKVFPELYRAKPVRG